MFEEWEISEVRELRQRLASLVAALDPDRMPAQAAPELWAEFDRVEKLAAAGKTLLAVRVEDSRAWKRSGRKDAAEDLARRGGTGIGAARDQLATSARLRDLPKTQAAVRAGRLSAAQAAAIADAATADPAAEDKLLALAATGSLPELRQECGRVKAAADPDPDATFDRIHATRGLRTFTDAEGGWNLTGRGTTVDGGAFKAVLDQLTDQMFRRAHNDGRREPMQAYAWDALMDMARRAGHQIPEPEAAPEPAPEPETTSGVAPADPADPAPAGAGAGAEPAQTGAAQPGQDAGTEPGDVPGPAPARPAEPSPQWGQPVLLDNHMTADAEPDRPAEADPPPEWGLPVLLDNRMTAGGRPEPPNGAPDTPTEWGHPVLLDSRMTADGRPEPPNGAPDTPTEWGHPVLLDDLTPAGGEPERSAEAKPPAAWARPVLLGEPDGTDRVDGGGSASPRKEAAPSPPSAGPAGSGPPAAGGQGPPGKKRPGRTNPRHLALIRIDAEALRRGAVQGEELCEITGVGPIPVSRARDLLGDAILKLVITNGVAVANITHLGRGPTAAQRIALMWSQPGCTAEACDRTYTEIDHREDWAKTRHTKLEELDHLCTGHHDLKTRHGWALLPGHGKRPMVPPDDPRHPRHNKGHAA